MVVVENTPWKSILLLAVASLGSMVWCDRSLAEESEYAYNDPVQGMLSFRPHPEEVVGLLPTDETAEAGEIEAFAEQAAEALNINKTEKLSRKLGIIVFRTTDALETGDVCEVAERTFGQGNKRRVPSFLPAFIDETDNVRYFHPGRVTVQFKPEVSEERTEQLLTKVGSEIVVKQRTRGYYTVTVAEEKTIFDTIRGLLEMREDVLFAEPDQIEFDSALEEDPDPKDEADFAKLWGIENTGQTVRGTDGLAGCDVRAVRAWQRTRGSARVVAVVIDTGADLDHPDLSAALEPIGSEDWDFADGDDRSPEDSGSHGTHVAGTIVGLVNEQGVVGVAPECRLMPLRIDLRAGRNANRADALNYVAAQARLHPQKRYVVNCSWRASGSYTAVLVSINNVTQAGGLVLFAAGNSGRDMDTSAPQFPAAHPTAVAVAAIDNRYRRSDFSNYGSQVDVSAPGSSIWSTVPGSHGFKSGTSMACPHAAGVSCLIWAANPSLSTAEVRQILESTAIDLGSHNPNLVGKLGTGLVCASAAVEEALASDSNNSDLLAANRIAATDRDSVEMSPNRETASAAAEGLAAAIDAARRRRVRR